ncbi:MAG: dockerin type I domain-containing protein [Patescibacteria group bacterium]
MDPNRSKIFFLLLALLLFVEGSVALAQVTETVTVSATVSGTTPPPPPAGGGGGGTLPNIAVRFTGEAYPFATVSILKEGAAAGDVLADGQGKFSATLEESYDSTILYTLFARDTSGERSLLINYPLVVRSGYLTHLSGIRFAPTVLADRAQVKAGDFLTIYGSSLPARNLLLLVSPQISLTGAERSFSLVSNAGGRYKIVVPTRDFAKGDYTFYIKYENDPRISKVVKFTVGDVNIPSAELTKNIPGDCNADQKINLVDFSILAFLYGKNNPPKCVDTNSDGIINLVDFSILAFWWTG